MEEEKLFEVDYSKKKFIITIEVCENGTTLKAESVNGCIMTYHEIIGVIECCKATMIEKQANKNKESQSAKDHPIK